MLKEKKMLTLLGFEPMALNFIVFNSNPSLIIWILFKAEVNPTTMQQSNMASKSMCDCQQHNIYVLKCLNNGINQSDFANMFPNTQF
jgi:hypothetical protein